MSNWIKAKAHANIALIKYWGKRDTKLNLPHTGSLSMTLDALSTQTNIRIDKNLVEDKITLNKVELGGPSKQALSHYLQLFRERSGIPWHAEVISENNFPTASGLASSSSGYAALAKAAAVAYQIEANDQELSVLARQGSGSAARSIYGQFVEMKPGTNEDGSDSYAQPVKSSFTDITMVICIVGGGKKKDISSRDAMNHCQDTSPYFSSWTEQVPKDLVACKALLCGNDFNELGLLVEANALAMHAAAMASRPSTFFFHPETLALIKTVQKLRVEGLNVFATMDAGPHVKVLCKKSDSSDVANNLSSCFPSITTIISGPGPGVKTLP